MNGAIAPHQNTGGNLKCPGRISRPFYLCVNRRDDRGLKRLKRNANTKSVYPGIHEIVDYSEIYV